MVNAMVKIGNNSSLKFPVRPNGQMTAYWSLLKSMNSVVGKRWDGYLQLVREDLDEIFGKAAVISCITGGLIETYDGSPTTDHNAVYVISDNGKQYVAENNAKVISKLDRTNPLPKDHEECLWKIEHLLPIIQKEMITADGPKLWVVKTKQGEPTEIKFYAGEADAKKMLKMLKKAGSVEMVATN